MQRAYSLVVSSLALVLAAIAWELVVRYGGFPPKLLPALGTVLETLSRLVTSGILVTATLATMTRLVLGFLVAAVIGVSIGILMGRYQWIDDTLVPIVSFMYPIPGIAYAPLFVLWFGLGDVPTVFLVGVASSFTIIINAWKGVRAVKPIWLRSAQAMGARDRDLFARIILPAALPYILTGLRLGLAAAWRILVAVEMLMSVQRGLGWMIFGSQEFLNTDVMLASIAVIGLIGVLLEKQVFERIERYTVVRWGMMTG